MSDAVETKIEELSENGVVQSDINPSKAIDEDERRERLRGLKQDTDERKRYANKLFIFLCVYMGLVFVVLLLNGFPFAHFFMSDSVTITLISTTTANIIAVFAFVVKYLFHYKG